MILRKLPKNKWERQKKLAAIRKHAREQKRKALGPILPNSPLFIGPKLPGPFIPEPPPRPHWQQLICDPLLIAAIQNCALHSSKSPLAIIQGILSQTLLAQVRVPYQMNKLYEPPPEGYEPSPIHSKLIIRIQQPGRPIREFEAYTDKSDLAAEIRKMCEVISVQYLYQFNELS